MAKKSGPIILVEDDLEDQEFVQKAFARLQIRNQLICFRSGESFLDYLHESTEELFLILCNLSLNGISGFEVRNKINATPGLKRKAIPFLFFTSDSRLSSVTKAYEATVQGYVTKQDTFEKLEKDLRLVIDYWTMCCHPGEC